MCSFPLYHQNVGTLDQNLFENVLKVYTNHPRKMPNLDLRVRFHSDLGLLLMTLEAHLSRV